jgi:hypothetical protein
MLCGYFDDSGTHDDSPVVTWGGFLGTENQWASLDRAWRAKLTRPLPGKPHLNKFALADCENRVNDFEAYSVGESDLLQNEFREIVCNAGLLGLAYAIDRPAWDRIIRGPARTHLGDAETACFYSCINGSIARAEELFKGESELSLCFDIGRKSNKFDRMLGRVMELYTGLPTLSFHFASVSTVPALQAADIVATENYWHAQDYLKGGRRPRPHLEHFLKRISTEGYVLDSGEIVRTAISNGFQPVSGAPLRKLDR